MSLGDHPGVDHAVVHRDVHAGHVRVVSNADLEAAVHELEILFPHEMVLTTPMGRDHTCVYTDTASAAVVAERISEHLGAREH